MDGPMMGFLLMISVLANLALAMTLIVTVRGRDHKSATAAANDEAKPKRQRRQNLNGLRAPSRRAAIIELTKRGLPEATIASVTGASRGEIVLAQRLRELQESVG